MRVLVVDDEKSIRISLKIGLEKLGLEVFAAESGEEALEIFERDNPDLVILDINLPGINGIDVLKRLKSISPTTTIIMITYMTDVKLAVEAMKIGAYDYFTKPFNLSDINKSIKEILDYMVLKKDLNSTEGGESPLIGESQSIQKIRDVISDICELNYDTSILITGESGTGKEVVAKSVHSCLNNKDKPFIAINCAAIPQNLQESELFGYEKGAFSDAKTDKEGLIEKANKGILFLDEIGDMDIGLQAKVLRVIQEKKYRRIGGTKEIEFEATILAATNKDLLKSIEAGEFRKDLYYRLNVIPINVPPLRERKEDISVLANYFVQEYNKRLNKNILSIDKEAMELLEAYNWPGNIRELKNLIERIMIFKKGDRIEVHDLSDEIRQKHLSTTSSSLEDAERATIERVLVENKWNISRSAKELNITRQTLRNKIEKYNIRK
ncbi:MAG: sigma-54 dependent transcriptional regulator [Tissierellaceae bacterium]|nr:sigma-54 dependent transcriptional regulator [Tissierellaceae bacterium]